MSLPQGWHATRPAFESGQAWVYRVTRDAEASHLYALKRLKNPRRRDRFVREIAAMQRLRSSHDVAIPEIIASDLDDERPWFVMPWYERGSLQEAVDDRRFTRDLSAGLAAAISLSEILSRVHSAGVAHRDLKPANVLVDAAGALALTDFGLCLEIDEDEARLTEMPEAIGSRLYIAPENEAGLNPAIDQTPADLYAFGKVIWALLAGRMPLPRERILDVENRLVAVLNEARLAPVDRLIDDLLNRDPRARLRDWSIVMRDLRAADSALRGVDIVQPRPASERALTAARRLRVSSVVQESELRRAQKQRLETWFSQLERSLQKQGQISSRPIAPLANELGDVLTIAATSGAAPLQDMLLGANVSVPDGFTSTPPSSGMSTNGAGVVSFVIHCPHEIDSFPTFTLRVWISCDEEQVWLTRLPVIAATGQQEQVPAFLLDALFKIAGPYPIFRQATVDRGESFVDESARLFITLAERYLEIVDSGHDPTAPEEWHDRSIVAAELIPANGETISDTTPPELRGFDIAPSIAQVSSRGASVTCRARIVDEQAGVAREGYAGSPCQARFRSPSGQFRDAMFSYLQLLEGDAQDGIYEDQVELPAYAERGAWVLEYVLVVDQVGNHRYYRAPELELQGFPTAFELR